MNLPIKKLEEILLEKKHPTSLVNNLCPECGSKEIINDHKRGECSCGNCGLVINERIIKLEGPRIYTQEEAMKKSQNKPLVTYGAATIISDGYKKSKIKHLNERPINNVESNIFSAMDILKIIKKIQPFNKTVIDDAWNIYEWCLEKRLIKGRGIKDVLATSLYISTRINKIPYFLSDITNRLKRIDESINEQRLINNYKWFYTKLNIDFNESAKEYGLSNHQEKFNSVMKPQVRLSDYIDTYFNRARMPPLVNNQLKTLIKKPAFKAACLGLTQNAIIATSIYCLKDYLSNNEYSLVIKNLKDNLAPDYFTGTKRQWNQIMNTNCITEELIGNFAFVTPATIRNTMKKIKGLLTVCGKSLTNYQD
ncbi:MAG: transcription initiation factor IIB family protein [Candidatus Nanoarchaeia archaeon]|jgi:transcription initiation factor TFIIIB Brf1 subunit/transcription initiation factor TFIIB